MAKLLAGLSVFAKEYGRDVEFCKRLIAKYSSDFSKCAIKYQQALEWREKQESHHQHLLLVQRDVSPRADQQCQPNFFIKIITDKVR